MYMHASGIIVGEHTGVCIHSNTTRLQGFAAGVQTLAGRSSEEMANRWYSENKSC